MLGKRRGDEELAGCPIGKWRQGSTNDMLAAKRYAFDNPKSFMNTIVNRFKPEGGKLDEGKLIKDLASLLYKRLFQNRRLSPDCYGIRLKRKHVEPEHRELSFKELEADELDSLSNESLPMVNPLEGRAKIWKDISEKPA
ncbi:hypothetical protein GGI16_004150 [Coemansia sp. S142-1]|nr:hypothetical protein GGI16_004150 [Coemansia sp. S142-1]